jgi:hypothetical protein
MRDAKWISYFRRAILLTMALPDCGGATAPGASAGAGSTAPTAGAGYEESGAVASIDDSSTAVPNAASEESAAPVLDSSAETKSVPPLQNNDAAADASCDWQLQSPARFGTVCNWSRGFTGDAITCAGFLGMAKGDACYAPCGPPQGSLTALSCEVQTDPDGGRGTVSCYGTCAVTIGNGGRRPLYFASLGFGPAPSGRELGTHFARAACMEAGSVEAFRWLRAELIAHGAPHRLIRAASRAIRDEIRHVRQTSALARRFGEEPVGAPPSPKRAIRPLLAMALENAVEGCVRETYSTLECEWQGHFAVDPVVRATMQRIARDEQRHLALSWAVHAWAMGKLDAACRAVVRKAQRAAIATLRNEVRRDPHESLLRTGGLPRAFQSQSLIEAIEARIAA